MLQAILECLRQERPLGKDTRVYENRGTPYPVTQKEIDEIQDRHKSFHKPHHYISKHRAAQVLIDAHAPGAHLDRDQLAAMARLQALGKLTRWGSDIAIKVFNDLDKIFFMGALRGHVYLRWSDASEHADWGGECHSQRIGRRIMIQLSTKVLKTARASLRDVWATLIHEMIHAHLFLKCGSFVRDDEPGMQGHGPIFQACMRALQHRIGPKNFINLTVRHSICHRPSWYTAGVYRWIDGGQGHNGHGRHHGNQRDDGDESVDVDHHRGRGRY